MTKAKDILNTKELPIQRRRSGPRLPILGLGAAAGAAAAYFLDPDRGRSRRAVTRDRLAGMGRRVGWQLARRARWSRGPIVGLGAQLANRESMEPINDQTLAHKVESELFRDPTVPKGQINVNAENGTVILRGIASSRDQIERLLATTASIDGVNVARSLLRTPDEPVETPVERPGASPWPISTEPPVGGGVR
jgi:hyperosmotically inducible periplasmic protein